MSQNIKIDIGDNLLKAITEIVRVVDRENRRADRTLCPGKAVRRAFGIDLVKLSKHATYTPSP